MSMLKEIIESVKSMKSTVQESKEKVIDIKDIKDDKILDLIKKYDTEVNYIDDGKKFDKVSRENEEIKNELIKLLPDYDAIKVDDDMIYLKQPKGSNTKVFMLNSEDELNEFIHEYVNKDIDVYKIKKGYQVIKDKKEVKVIPYPKCLDDKEIKNPFNKKEILIGFNSEKCLKDFIEELKDL